MIKTESTLTRPQSTSRDARREQGVMGKEKRGRLCPITSHSVPSHHTPRTTKERQGERETTGDESGIHQEY